MGKSGLFKVFLIQHPLKLPCEATEEISTDDLGE